MAGAGSPRLAWTAVAVPVLVLVALLGGAVARGETVLGYDFTVFNIPQLTQLAAAYERFSIPGWNPLCGLGQPFAADLAVAPYYPPHGLALVLSPAATLLALVASHLVLGYAGAFQLARARGRSPLAAHVVALAHGLGGIQIGYVAGPALLYGTALLPWCALRAAPALAPGAPPRQVALAGVPFALSFLGAAPESCALAALLALALAVADGAPPWRAMLRLVAVGGAAMALASVSLVPFALGAGDTNRGGGLAYDVASTWSVRPLELLGVAVPGYAPLEPLERGAFERRPFHPVMYLGVVTLALGAVGLGASWRRPATRALGVVLVLALLHALGRNGPLYPLLWEVLPPVRFVRYPAKALALAVLALALLAGAGLDALRPGGDRPREGALRAGRATGVGLALAAAAAAVAALAAGERGLALRLGVTLASAAVVAVALRPDPARLARRALVVALAVELVVSAGLALDLGPRELYSPRPPRFAVALQREQEARGEPVRVAPLSDVVGGALAVVEGARGLAPVYGAQREALVPNAGACWGLRAAEEMSSYTAWRPETLRREVARRGPGGLAVLRLHAVTHVVVLAEQLPSPEVEPIDVSGALALARLRGAPAWAAVYPRAHAARDARDALERVLAPGFAPARECVVEGAPEVPSPPDGEPALPARARPLRVESDRLEVEVEAPRDGAWLVVREGFAPGWTATVDGAPAPVHAADLVFRAVPLPAGRHVVVLSYEARGRAAGAWISAVAWAAVLGAALRGRLARR